jgi:hypothetical protein
VGDKKADIALLTIVKPEFVEAFVGWSGDDHNTLSVIVAKQFQHSVLLFCYCIKESQRVF